MSFVFVEPQSRVLLESHANSLLAQFDTHLQIIANRYLAFFQKRRSIEATYIDSLLELHRKACIDPFIEPTTTRAAWDNVRDNLEREAHTRQAFVNILDNDVIKPLITLKESEDKTRKRIEEDLKESAAKYADYAANTISGYQQEYLKKYYPQQDDHPTDISRRPPSLNIPNKRFGGKVSALFRGRQRDLREREPVKQNEELVPSDDDCRLAVAQLNNFRSMRTECLRDGYDCLEEFAFTPTVKDVLVKYMDGMITAYAKHGDLATSTGAEVQKALAGADTFKLTASFRHSLSFSIPPPIVVSSYRPGYSNLIFGVPLADLETNEDNIPKVMRMCIEEVEKKGLNTPRVYAHYSIDSPGVLHFRRRFECEKSFSFNSADNIYLVAMLLKRYLLDLPEPLFTLSLGDYRDYRQTRTRSIENDFSLLRSKIGEAHPVHRASLGALMRHLLRVASHSDKNSMTVEALASQFSYDVLRGNEVSQDGVNLKSLVLEDLIRNAQILFEERLSPTRPVPSPDMAETTSTYTYSSVLSPELPQPAGVQAMDSTTRHGPGLVGGIPTSTQSSLSSLTPDAAMESRLTPPTALLSPLLGFPSSQTLTEGVETTTQGQVIAETRGTNAVETLPDSTPPEVASAGSISVAEWRLHQSRLSPHPEAVTIPQSPPESVLSGTSEFPLSSATSLQTALSPMRPFSP
ncbi:hypothetical protein BJY52DRAFT_527106 [Lactarius psammicola]|nr:hypothetical protein BJY52DRAFT_527106 [Lactarius psammicola]